MAKDPDADHNPMHDPAGNGRWCPDHQRWECAKKAKRGPVCHNSRIRGLDRCRMHAGQSRELAKQRGAMAVAMATYGDPVQVGPSEALLEELHRTAGHVAWLRTIVADLEQGDLVWGLVEEIDRPPGERSAGGIETRHKAVPNQWLQLYQAERKHLAQVAKAAIDAGVSERVVQVYEQIASSYVQVIERVLDRLALSPEQRAMVPGLMQEELGPIVGGTR